VSVQIIDVSDGVLTVEIRGTLEPADLRRAQASALEAIRTHGKLRLLVIATGFLGWKRDEDWSDVAFPAQQDRNLEKMAIVGDQRWEDLVLAFTGKGFRPVAIQYFPTAHLARARAWVASP
jgi:hypothetical protein